MKRKLVIILTLMICSSFMISAQTFALTDSFRNSIYNPGPLKPLDSLLKVKVGDRAPGFSLPSVSGKIISLSDYRDKKIVVLSFVPAAWTPVCSDQWPGYNIVEELFEEQNAVLLGITVDNIPTLFSWIQQMGDLWFPVLSDFWPHGAVADSFGLLRTDGVAERALVVIDKNGIISYIGVGDINVRPPLEVLIKELQKLNSK
ncbi:MAG: peroxiredoxin [Pseudomonadota bacterium]|nr:peroxiredoxin [Pseudomonadota bacterium]